MALPSIYQSNAAETPIFRKWLLRGLLISLAVHLALYAFSRMTTLEKFSTETTARLVPRQFTVQQLQVNEELLDQQDQNAATPDKQEDTVPAIPLPSEANLFEKEMEEVIATPAAPEEVAQPLLDQKPEIDPSALNNLAKLQAGSESTIQSELDSIHESLIRDAPEIISGSQLQLPGRSDVPAPGEGGSYSNIDELLGQSGGLKEGTAPILLPTDLLFAYNSADLRPNAVASLRKLGQLITKNPDVIFTIEGHADSFGSATYNQSLSEQRAESVKRWLVTEMNLDAGKIRTRGYGATKLQAPASGSVEEQQINRRVEIVMEFP